MFDRILLPLDGSETAEQVMPWAHAFADRFRLPVELLTVIDAGTFLTSMEAARRFDALLEQATREGREYLERISGRFAPNPVKRSLEQGITAEVIIGKAAADESTLIAMATHGHSGMDRWLMGSVAEKILRGSKNPLLLVRAVPKARTAREATPKSLLIPLDGSELAETVLPSAAKIAAKFALEVVLLRAYTNPFTPFIGGTGPYTVQLDELKKHVRDEAEAYLEATRAALKKDGIEKISCIVQEGDAADHIVSMARPNPEMLIVIGSHGRSGLQRWALGSVTETVVRHAANPVLVLRAR